MRHSLDRSPEALAVAAQEEARRSRAAGLNSNRIFEGAVDAALKDLIEVDEHGNVRLRDGAQVADVEKVARARHTHIKTTQLLTGEAAAVAKSTAAAGAPRILLGASMLPQPIDAKIVDEKPA